MNKFERYIVDLLQHHITYDNREVQVRRQFNDIEDLPCITLSVAGVSTEKVYAMKTDTSEEAQYERRATIDINVWCNTEEERESITEQVMQCYMKEQMGDYTYCSRYDDGFCESLGEQCPVPQGNSVRRRKGLCDHPVERDYEPLWKRCGIIEGSMNIEPPVMMDEYDVHPPLLRSRFGCEASYYDVRGVDVSKVEVDYEVEIK